MKRRDFLRGGLAIGTVAITDPASASSHLISVQDFIRFRLCPPGKTYVRRDIYTLLNQDPNHPVIKAYSDGVKAMKALPDDNPSSWAYQANIHGTTLASNQWPAGAPFETCEHSSWTTLNLHFLPWHRMYLYFFEKIVRIQSGDLDFALPYWNYTKSGQAAIPEPLRTPADASNPLFDGSRSATLNNGGSLSSTTTNTATALGKTDFGGSSGFSSSLEGTPHGVVHSTIGGNMGGFSGAGRDPVFWLHHCNIDRLWEKWLSQGGGRANPIGDSAWMGRTATFVDECGHFVTMTNSDVLDTIAQLKYRYDDPSGCIPLLVAQLPLNRFLAKQVRPLENLVLASAVRLDLEQREARVRVEKTDSGLTVPEALREFGLLEREARADILLKLEELTLEEPLNGYFEVYLSLRGQESGRETDQVYVGNLSTFGADRASREAMERAMKDRGMDMQGGVSASLNVTETLRKLAGAFDGQAFDVEVSLRATDGVESRDGPSREALNMKAEPRLGGLSLEIVPRE